jgi:DNA topoisomerase-1
VSIDIASANGAATLRATGSVLVFDGFLSLYQEDRDDPSDSDDETARRLPPLKEGEGVERQAVTPLQHFTQPPPRYTEASLVKRLEELGIGRPSTYASILQVLQDRSYVKLEKKRLIPEDRGRLVTAFLTSFFERYVQYNFTAELENELDEISAGKIDWRQVLRDFWQEFSKSVEGTRDLTITQVIDALDEELGRHFFPEDGSGKDARLCPACGNGRLGLRLGKFGAFVGCSNYPECRYTRRLVIEDGEAAEGDTGPRELGKDPATGQPVTLRKGPYGTYVQLGEAEGNGKEKVKPKRASLPKGMAPADVDLDRALALLALPRDVGPHPETREMITAGIGRFGPYIKHGTAYKSLGADDDVLSIGLNRAVVLLAEAPAKGRGAPGKTVGNHPSDNQPITLHSGRYGPYLRHGKVLASLPRTMTGEPSVDEAVQILAAQAEKKKGKGKAAPAKRAAKANGDAAAGESKPAKKAAAKPKAKPAKAKQQARKGSAEKKGSDRSSDGRT